MNQKIRVTVWSEFRHERHNEAIRAIYPEGLHGLATADDLTCATWEFVPDVHEWMEASTQWLLETM